MSSSSVCAPATPSVTRRRWRTAPSPGHSSRREGCTSSRPPRGSPPPTSRTQCGPRNPLDGCRSRCRRPGGRDHRGRRGRGCRRHPARPARPRADRVALQLRRPHLRGSRARHRRHDDRVGCGPAARQGRPRTDRPDRRARAGGARRLPGPGPSGAGQPLQPALFLNARGGRLSRQSAWQVLSDAAERAGLQTSVSPHTMRHSFATTCSTAVPTSASSRSCSGTRR